MAGANEKGILFPEDDQRKGENIQMVSPKDSPEGGAKIKENQKFSYLNYFKEYTSRTSLHGLQYLGEDDRHLVERIWWFVMFVLSLLACIFLITKVWLKWEYSPVIVSFAEVATPVWQLPFPAITICSMSRIDAQIANITDYKNRYPNLTQEEMEIYITSSIFCERDSVKKDKSNVTKEDIEFIKKVFPSVSDMLVGCQWKNKAGKCTQFYPSITESGRCATFNSLNFDEFYRKEEISSFFYSKSQPPKSEWSIDEGYFKKNQTQSRTVYPVRASGSGISSGFQILLKTLKSSYDYECSGLIRGFVVSLHSPTEYPKTNKNAFILPINQMIVVATKPVMLGTAETLKEYQPHKRQCFFQNERRLKFFKTYSQQNCEIECLANYTSSACGCAPLWMLRNSTTMVCPPRLYNCVEQARADLFTVDDADVDESSQVYAALKESGRSCDCLPSCTSITYDVETSQTPIEFNKIEGVELSGLIVYFKDSQIFPSNRYELYGQTDFLANCGGLLGLCLGFSVLSLVEILYFMTIRLVLYTREKMRARMMPIRTN